MVTKRAALLLTALMVSIVLLSGCKELFHPGSEENENGGGYAPSAPTGVTATPLSSSSIQVTWTAGSGATKHHVYRAASANGTYTQIDDNSVSGYIDYGLSASTTYYYKIYAENSYAATQSSYTSAATLSESVSAPSAPTGVTAEAQSSISIQVSWSAPSSGMVSEYYVYRATSYSGPYTTRVGSADTITSTAYTDTGLNANTTYYYKVSAKNSGGESGQSIIWGLATTLPANMVLVEEGTFLMGSAYGDDDEKPVHQVTVKSFYMGKYEVTQKEWREVMGTTIGQQRDIAQHTDNTSDYQLWGEGDNYPMYYVSWEEAAEYCNKRSQREGLRPCYRSSGGVITCDWNANGYRLPTEAEWEYAAKGGGRDFLEYEYSGGSNLETVGWYTGNSGSSTHPVGTKAANSLGIYDMSGNVWEWCWDWYGPYGSGAQSDPSGAASGSGRVLRGGSWVIVARGLRSAIRAYGGPSIRSYDLGFRLVRPAQ